MQQGIVPIWSLLEACRTGTTSEQELAATSAAAVVAQHACAQGTLTLDVLGSLLSIDGYPAVSSADTFAATHGLLQFLRDAGVQRVQFGGDVQPSALHQWAVQVVAATTPASWPVGIEVQVRHDPLVADVMTPQPPSKSRADACDSRLRSVFLQHRLIAGLPAIEGVDAMVAKLVIQGVVDRLLQVPGGLEPLMLLQQDEELLQRSTAVAVLAVVIARSAGWSVEQLADIGAAALLHDVGAMLDADAPARAAFHWLLERGNEDFWLRSALIARRWRDGQQSVADPAGPLAVVGVVRLAIEAHRRGAKGMAAVADAGSAPAELAQIAIRALAAT